MAKKPTINKPQIKLNKTKIKPAGKGERKPVFESLFGDPPAELTPDPLAELEYSGDIERDGEAEANAILEAIKREKALRRDAYRLLVDSEYFLVICFQSREQKEEYLRLKGWDDLGDKYLNGLAIADREGLAIEPINLPAKPTRAMPKLLRRTPIIK